MRAFQISQFGLENLKKVDLPTPAPGVGEVLIRVRAVSLNYRDLLMIRGQYDPRLHLPRIPLSDGAGEIVEIGAGVHGFRVGDRVTGLFLQNWQDGAPTAEKSRGALGGELDGMLAEYVVLPEDGIVAFPENLSYQEAATLPCAALTAWNALFEASKIKPGDNVLIQGTGGVSIFALQFARLAGARVLGTSRSDEKLARAKQLGLDEGLNTGLHPEWGSWVKDQTGGRGADLIVEVGGSGTLAESMKAVRVGGTIAQIGVLSGAEERLSVRPILRRQIQIAGVFVGSRSMVESMHRAIQVNGLKPVVDTVFDFDDTHAAFRAMEKQVHFGKIVIALSVQ